MYILLNICRLCLSYKNELYDLCSDDIMEKLVACISDLEFEDHVPSVICEKCLEQVDFYYEFRNKCLRSEFIINNYVEVLLGGIKNSQLRSKLQVKLSKNFSPSKFSSNVKLSHPTLVPNSSKNANMNNNLENVNHEEVHTDITERVKLRKRCQAKRTLGVSTENQEIGEKNSPVDRCSDPNKIENIPVEIVTQNVKINASKHSQVLSVPETVKENLPIRLHRSPIVSVSEESASSAVTSIIAEPLRRSSFDTSYLHSAQASTQSKNCHLQTPDNSNQKLTNQIVTHEGDCEVKVNQNQTVFHEVPVTSNKNQRSSEDVSANLNQNVGSNKIDDIIVDNEESTVYVIDDEDEDIPDEINRMMLLESLLSKKPRPISRPHSCIPSTKTPTKRRQRKKKRSTTPNFDSNNHISVTEHNYSGKLYVPNRKKFKLSASTIPALQSSSSSYSDESEVDVEKISENEETKGHKNAVKCMMEKNRRNRLRSSFENLICSLPASMQSKKRSRLDVLHCSEDYIKSLEKEIIDNIDEVYALTEKNLQLKERLTEIKMQR